MEKSAIELPGDHPDAIDALRRSCLDVVLAGTDPGSFQAAHGNTESIMVLDLPGDRTVWITTGTNEERHDLAEGVRQRLKDKGMTL